MMGERFVVLATCADGRLHPDAIHIAATDRWELAHALRPEEGVRTE